MKYIVKMKKNGEACNRFVIPCNEKDFGSVEVELSDGSLRIMESEEDMKCLAEVCYGVEVNEVCFMAVCYDAKSYEFASSISEMEHVELVGAVIIDGFTDGTTIVNAWYPSGVVLVSERMVNLKAFNVADFIKWCNGRLMQLDYDGLICHFDGDYFYFPLKLKLFRVKVNKKLLEEL